jgi:hypothetical protein
MEELVPDCLVVLDSSVDICEYVTGLFNPFSETPVNVCSGTVTRNLHWILQ